MLYQSIHRLHISWVVQKTSASIWGVISVTALIFHYFSSIVWTFTVHTFNFMNPPQKKSLGALSQESMALKVSVNCNLFTYQRIVYCWIPWILSGDSWNWSCAQWTWRSYLIETTNNWCSSRNNSTYDCRCLSSHTKKVKPILRFTGQPHWNALMTASQCNFDLLG